jgi:hypothetical protein
MEDKPLALRGYLLFWLILPVRIWIRHASGHGDNRQSPFRRASDVYDVCSQMFFGGCETFDRNLLIL